MIVGRSVKYALRWKRARNVTSRGRQTSLSVSRSNRINQFSHCVVTFRWNIENIVRSMQKSEPVRGRESDISPVLSDRDSLGLFMIYQMNISSTVFVCEFIETFALHFAFHTWMRSQSSHVVRWGMNFSFSLFFFLLRPGTFFGVWIHSKFPFGCLTVIRACFPGGTSCCKISMRGLANRTLHTMQDKIFVHIISTKHKLIYCIFSRD